MTVSIIIPALNEEACLGENLLELREQAPSEIIVVDGGSTDGTCQTAANADVVLQGPRGRSAQMNLGAAHARGDVLLFLHADCRLESGAVTAATELLQRPGVAAGCFSMCVSARGLLYRSIETCANLRVKLTGLAYGDQGLFVRRDDFCKAGRLSARPPHGGPAFQQGTAAARPDRSGSACDSRVGTALAQTLAASGVTPDRLASFYPQVR